MATLLRLEHHVGVFQPPWHALQTAHVQQFKVATVQRPLEGMRERNQRRGEMGGALSNHRGSMLWTTANNQSLRMREKRPQGIAGLQSGGKTVPLVPPKLAHQGPHSTVPPLPLYRLVSACVSIRRNHQGESKARLLSHPWVQECMRCHEGDVIEGHHLQVSVRQQLPSRRQRAAR